MAYLSTILAVIRAACIAFGWIKAASDREDGRKIEHAREVEATAEAQRRIDAVPTPDDDEVTKRLQDGTA